MSFRLSGVLAAVPVLGGCSFGLFQTAHTQPPGTVSGRLGLTYVTNEIADEGGRGGLVNLGLEPAVRVGVAPRVDLGLGTFYFTGFRADAKVNVLDPKSPWALALRGGFGNQFSYDVLMLEGGIIGSYRYRSVLEPYAGLTYANHWISSYSPPVAVPKDQAPRSGSGDGLLQAALGVELGWKYVGLMAEYDYLAPLNNDPGDFFAFVPTHVVGLAIRFGRMRGP